jgi:CBS domain-containing protein
MKVSAVMTRSTKTILPDATVEQAARKMKDWNVGLLPVVHDGKVMGVVTDRDIVIRTVAENRNPHLTTVREIMTRKALCCDQDQPVGEAAKIMEKNHVRRLVVLNDQSRIVGVLTITDLALKAANEKLPAHVLQRVTGAA